MRRLATTSTAPGLIGWCCLATLCWALAHSAAAQTGVRVALVLGNAAYTDAPLRNPVNDAQDLSAKLRGLGFEVSMATNRNRAQMTAAIRDFGSRAAGADAALFYFAGHGVQVRGRNYLLPVGQAFADEAEVETDAVDVNNVLARLEEAGAKVSLLILDACRTAPLQRRGRSSGRGLARMEAPSGALIAFAAQPGAEAQDGDGRNGVFTKHLLAHIGTPGVPVEQLFKRVRAEVERETGRTQSPREESSLTAEFYFANPFARVSPQDQVRIEDEAWALCRSASTAGPCEDYLASWPQGRYVGLAKTKLRELQALARPAPPVAAARGVGETFRDCAACPEMVVIGAGSFTMGSPAGEAGRGAGEGPQRSVSIGRSFALGRYEVTADEFRRFVQAANYVTEAERNVGADGCYARHEADGTWDLWAGRSWRSPGFEQPGRHPVVCVSWNDAQTYIQWLSKQTGQSYRLPSEAEWEYAARAGSNASRPWGDDPGEACRYANVADRGKSPSGGTWQSGHECSDGHWFTAPVGSYAPNRFGLSDMIGNVLEWVQDCYDKDAYRGKAPSDGRAYDAATCFSRALRGGSWGDFPARTRSAARVELTPYGRSSVVGFRLARMLP